jgi:hypothetical protein
MARAGTGVVMTAEGGLAPRTFKRRLFLVAETKDAKMDDLVLVPRPPIARMISYFSGILDASQPGTPCVA